jgi:hypothetical protein
MSLTKLVGKRKERNHKMRVYIEKSYDLYNSFFETQYIYDDTEALEELGIDSELIHQLLEDFAIQIIQSNITLHKTLSILKKEKLHGEELDFTPFRNAIHKNLGVARNLRVKDSIEVLTKLMEETDFQRMEELLEVFEACAFKLKPTQAYEALQFLKKFT